MCRKDDEGLYQPKIHSQRIRELHVLCERLQVPMTVVVDEALKEYIEETNKKLDQFKQ